MVCSKSSHFQFDIEFQIFLVLMHWHSKKQISQEFLYPLLLLRLLLAQSFELNPSIHSRLTDATQEFLYIICLLTFVSEKHKNYLIFIKQLYNSCSQIQSKSILGLATYFHSKFWVKYWNFKRLKKELFKN